MVKYMEYPKKGRYRHFKGGEYELLYIARHSETDEPMVVYRALYECGETPLGERIWVRPLSMWTQIVERDGRRFPRFRYVGDEETIPLPEEAPVMTEPQLPPPPEEAPAFFEPRLPEYEAADVPWDPGAETPVACETDRMNEARRILGEIYGYPDFRPGQEKAIRAILSGRDTFGVMPTGAGKSLCYQIPALTLHGTAIVISPLISLMKDQVEALRQSGVAAAYLNTSLTESQITTALGRMAEGRYKIVYAAPERLLTERFLRTASRIEISLVAVDEAHCISQWGQDFRPSYLDIDRFVSALPKRPRLCAFTATATQKVRRDIRELLRLRDPEEIVTGFDRPNLYFSVLRPANRMTKLMELMQTYSDMSGIIYCATRKTVEEVCGALNEKGIRATRYHAGLSEEERRINQEAFSMDEIPVMVATNAFGMGIDKSNVRFVIHYNLPKDMESYYQEAGRAGRDGLRADCVLLYAPQDLTTQSYFIDHLGEEAGLNAEDTQKLKKTARLRLNAMKQYAVSGRCLRGEMLSYFGEKTNGRCGKCAVCDGLVQLESVTDSARVALKAVKELHMSFGAGTISRLLKGSSDAAILSRGLNRHPCYGALAELTAGRIGDILDVMVEEDVLKRTGGDYPVLVSGPEAEALLNGEKELFILQEPPRESRRKRTAKRAETAADTGLLTRLKQLRRDAAAQRRIPPYMVFSDATLVDMAAKKPRTEAEFVSVFGVGRRKWESYGREFLACIDEWEAEA